MFDEQLRALIDGGVEPVTFEEIQDRARRPATGRARLAIRRYRMPISIAAGAAAAAAALTLAATGQLSSHHETPSLATTAVIRHMESATKAALAKSGKVHITSRSHGLVEIVDKNGHRRHPVEIGTSTYSFAGKDHSASSDSKVQGQPDVLGVNIVRLVHGQEYFYTVGFPCPPKHPHCDTSKHRWHHLVGHLTKFRGMADPRSILKVLAPSAKFVSEGTQTINGVRTTRLKATRLANLGSLPNITSHGQKLTGLTVWADAHGVVRQIHLSGRDGYISSRKGSHVTYPKRLRFTSTYDFLDIGVRQHIVAPKHAIKYVSK